MPCAAAGLGQRKPARQVFGKRRCVRGRTDAEGGVEHIRPGLFRPATALPTVVAIDASPMSPYQGFKLFSQVVLGLMAGGIVYAGYIAVTYWTGISV